MSGMRDITTVYIAATQFILTRAEGVWDKIFPLTVVMTSINLVDCD